MPTDPDNGNAIGKKVDTTRLLQAMSTKAWGEGRMLKLSQDDYNKMAKLTNQQAKLRGMNIGTGSRLSPYGQWLNTPIRSRSKLLENVMKFPLLSALERPLFPVNKTWYGTENRSNRQQHNLNPIAMLDSAARSVAQGKVPLKEIAPVVLNPLNYKMNWYGKKEDGEPLVGHGGSMPLKQKLENLYYKYDPYPVFTPDGNPTNQSNKATTSKVGLKAPKEIKTKSL